MDFIILRNGLPIFTLNVDPKRSLSKDEKKFTLISGFFSAITSFVDTLDGLGDVDEIQMTTDTFITFQRSYISDGELLFILISDKEANQTLRKQMLGNIAEEFLHEFGEKIDKDWTGNINGIQSFIDPCLSIMRNYIRKHYHQRRQNKLLKKRQQQLIELLEQRTFQLQQNPELNNQNLNLNDYISKKLISPFNYASLRLQTDYNQFNKFNNNRNRNINRDINNNKNENINFKQNRNISNIDNVVIETIRERMERTKLSRQLSNQMQKIQFGNETYSNSLSLDHNIKMRQIPNENIKNTHARNNKTYQENFQQNYENSTLQNKSINSLSYNNNHKNNFNNYRDYNQGETYYNHYREQASLLNEKILRDPMSEQGQKKFLRHPKPITDYIQSNYPANGLYTEESGPEVHMFHASALDKIPRRKLITAGELQNIFNDDLQKLFFMAIDGRKSIRDIANQLKIHPNGVLESLMQLEEYNLVKF